MWYHLRMKRLPIPESAAGLFLATATLLGPGHAAEAQTAAECVPVFDESQPNVIEDDIQEAIDDFENRGTDVHVQIINDGPSRGITGEGDPAVERAIAYTERLADLCGWSDSNRVNVLVSTSPRTFAVYKPDAISQSVVNEAQNNARDNFRDTSTSFQSDVAELLEQINPDTPRPASSNNEGGTDLPDLPLKEIFIGLGATAAAVALLARIKVGVDLYREKHEALTSSQEVTENIRNLITEALAQMSGLPEDDRPAVLTGSQSQATDLEQRADKANGELTGTYNRNRFRVWPHLDEVQAGSDVAEAVVQEQISLEDIIEAAIQELADNRNNVGTVSNNFETGLQTLNTLVNDLTEAGWDTASTQDTIANLQEVFMTSQELREQGYINKPADTLEAKMPTLEETRHLLETLVERRAAVEVAHLHQDETITEQTAKVSVAAAQLAALRSDYDESCVSDLATFDEQFTDLLEDLTATEASLRQQLGIKSDAAVTEGERLAQTFDGYVAELQQMQGTIAERQAQLEDIKQNLPARLEAATNSIGDAHTFAEENSADVEQETQQAISKLQKRLKDFADSQVDVAKPKYLELDTELADLTNQVSEITTRALDEQTEMVNLRHNVTTFGRQLEDAINSARQTASDSDVDSSTQSAINGLSFSIDTSTDQGRQDLRDTQEELSQAIAKVRELEDEAQDEIDEAEAERRRRRAAQQSSYTSTSISSSGGFGSIGGGFGGFSGGGGGGSSSGGSW